MMTEPMPEKDGQPDGAAERAVTDLGMQNTPNAEKYVLAADAMRRRQLRSALLHGSTRTWREYPRMWIKVCIGAIVVAVILAGLAVTEAFQKTQENEEKQREQRQEQQQLQQSPQAQASQQGQRARIPSPINSSMWPIDRSRWDLNNSIIPRFEPRHADLTVYSDAWPSEMNGVQLPDSRRT